MPLAATDLKWYGSSNMPRNDSDICGGLIDVSTRVVFDNTTLPNVLNGLICMYSSLAEDTGAFKVYGRDTSKVLNSENFTLNGVTQVSGSVTFSELLMCSGAHHGTLTIQDQTTHTTIIAMESGVNILRKPFYDLKFNTGGKTAYEKIFLRNNHATDALQDVYLTETSDPSGCLTYAVASGQNDSGTTSNRLTLPTSIAAASFTSSTSTIPGTHLYPSSGIGCWLKLSLEGTMHTFASTYTIQSSGTIVT